MTMLEPLSAADALRVSSVGAARTLGTIGIVGTDGIVGRVDVVVGTAGGPWVSVTITGGGLIAQPSAVPEPFSVGHLSAAPNTPSPSGSVWRGAGQPSACDPLTVAHMSVASGTPSPSLSGITVTGGGSGAGAG